MADGPDIGLRLLAELAPKEELQSYFPFFATRAELSRRVARHADALADYRRGLGLAQTEPERRFMSRRIAETEALLAAANA
jgi:RNA polymerase sigma-70 factor (ECF subfamily)